MSVKVEKLDGGKVKFTIEVDNAKFLEAENKAFEKAKGKLSAPGFRKGKVTKEMAFKIYGRNAFLEDTINQCINSTYYDEAKTTGFRLLSQPKINVLEADINKPFIYEATVAVLPEVKLPKYKGVKIDKTNIVVSDDDVNKKIEEEREKNARIVPVTRNSKIGDILTIDFDGYIDGKAFKGGKGEKYPLTLGSHTFIDNFEEQLVDKKIGDEVDVNVKFPENYGAKELAGKSALFKVKIHEIKEKELPELNDEFVSEISEFEKLDDYKADIRKKMTEAREKEQKEIDKTRILDEIAKNVKIDLAEEAIDAQVEDMLYDFESRLRYQGFDMDKYLKMMGKNLEDYKKEIRPNAEKSLLNSAILEQIAKEEKIEATDEMVNAEIENMAKSYGMDVNKFKENYASPEQLKRMKDDLLYPAVFDFLYNNAEIK